MFSLRSRSSRISSIEAYICDDKRSLLCFPTLRSSRWLYLHPGALPLADMRDIYHLLNIETESACLFEVWKPGKMSPVCIP